MRAGSIRGHCRAGFGQTVALQHFETQSAAFFLQFGLERGAAADQGV